MAEKLFGKSHSHLQMIPVSLVESDLLLCVPDGAPLS
jgi:hypothetical protein